MCRPANKKQKAEAVKKKKREQMYNFALMSKQNKRYRASLSQKKTNLLYMGSIRILSMYELENHGLRREW